MTNITAFDYVLLPLYLLVVFKIAYNYRDKHYPKNHSLRRYFIPALYAKIGGALFIAFIYGYYYGGGDSFNFFYHSKIINSTFIDSPDTWLRLITHHADDKNLIDEKALSDMYWYDDIASYTTACIASIIGLFCFTKYLIITIIIATISFIGSWLMFIAFTMQYKNMEKHIAIAILFIPGPLVWGSGLFKDSFCMFSIGCLVYCFYMLLEKRTFKLSLILLGVTSIMLLILIKAYILVALLPLLIIKTILAYKKKAIEKGRKFLFYTVLFMFYFAFSLVLKRAASYLSAFTAENVLETIKHQKDYLLSVSIAQDGSAYDIGDFEPSLNGIVKMIIPAINVTLFRPYPWESKSIIQLFNSLESTAILLLTLYLILKRNIFKTIKYIYNDPNLIMCLFFTLIFAFIVGLSSYNFGSLSRYKIPCTPFYVLFLMILIFKDRSNNNIDDKSSPIVEVDNDLKPEHD